MRTVQVTHSETKYKTTAAGNSSPNWIVGNNEQKDNPNYMPLHSNYEEPKEANTTHMRYGRIVERPDSLTYY